MEEDEEEEEEEDVEGTHTPMDALLVETMPEGPGWQYEPKWNGFRCLVFRGVSPIPIHE